MNMTPAIEKEFKGFPVERKVMEREIAKVGRKGSDVESALGRFGGRSREVILASLRQSQSNGSATWNGLEEWALLYPERLQYFAPAYMQFALDQLALERPDAEFVAMFFAQVVSAMRINGGEAFTATQKGVLLQLAEASESAVESSSGFSIWRGDITRYIAACRLALSGE